jgi:hypothetical protein
VVQPVVLHAAGQLYLWQRTPQRRNANLDISAFKELFLYDRLKVQFRTDAFSALNHPLPQEPQNTISSASTFGQITDWGGTRNLQLSLKVLW